MQSLFNSLTKSTSKLPEPASLQRSNSSIVISPHSTPSYCKISGNYTFFISPRITTKESVVLTQANMLVINSFTDSSCKYAIAFSCKWYRIINDKSYLLPINSNTFQLSAFDIGSSLKCEAKSEEDDYKGVAILHIGPILPDEMLRSDLENILESSQSKYMVRLVNEIKDLIGKDKLVFILNKDHMRVLSTNSSNNLLEIQYSITFPEIEVDFSDSLRIALIFRNDNPDYEKVKGFLSIKQQSGLDKLRLGILFENKNIRDVFLIVIRCLAAKKYLVATRIIDEYSSLEKFLSISQKNRPNNNTLDLILEIEKLKKKNDQILLESKEIHLSKLPDPYPKEPTPNPKHIEEKRLYEKKIYELEAQIKDLTQPTKMFQEFDMKQSFLSDVSFIEKFAKEDNMTAKDSDLEIENTYLKKLVHELEEDKKQRENKNNEAFELKMMNDMLRMEVNTYKAQRESQGKEISHLKESLERMGGKRGEGALQRKDNTDINKIKEVYESKITALENQLKKMNNPMEVTKLFEDNTRLKIEIEKITKDSIIQRGKLIAERDKLKAESAQNPNRTENTKKSSFEPLPQNYLIDIEKLKQELESQRKTSIIERGKLIEERNRLKAELEIFKQKGSSNDFLHNIERNSSNLNEEYDILKREFEEFKRKSLWEKTRLSEELTRLEKDKGSSGIKAFNEENSLFSDKLNERDQRIARFLIEANENHERIILLSHEVSALKTQLNEKDTKIQLLSKDSNVKALSLSEEINGLKTQLSEKEHLIYKENNENHEKTMILSQEMNVLKNQLSEKEQKTEHLAYENSKLTEELKLLRSKQESGFIEHQSQYRRILEEKTLLLDELHSLKENNEKLSEGFDRKNNDFLKEKGTLCLEIEGLKELLKKLKGENEGLIAGQEKFKEEIENSNKNLINSKISLIEGNTILRNELESLKKRHDEEKNFITEEFQEKEKEFQEKERDLLKKSEVSESKLRDSLLKIDEADYKTQKLSSDFMKKTSKYKKLKGLFKEKQILLQEKEQLLSEFLQKLTQKNEEITAFKNAADQESLYLKNHINDLEKELKEKEDFVNETIQKENTLRNEVKMLFLEKEAQIKKNFQLKNELAQLKEGFEKQLENKLEGELKEKNKREADLVESLKVLMKDKKSLLQEVQNMKNSFEKLKEQALELERYNEEMKGRSHKELMRSQSYEIENKKISEGILTLERELEQTKIAKDSSEAKIKELEEEILIEYKEKIEGIEKERGRLEKENKKLLEKKERLENDKKELMERIDSIGEENNSLKKEILEGKQEILGFREEIEKFKEEGLEYRQEIANYESETSNYKQKISKFEEEINTYQEKLNIMENKIQSYEEKISTYQQEIITINQNLTGSEIEITALKQNISKYEQDMINYKENLSKKENQLIWLNQVVIKSEDALLQLKNEKLAKEKLHIEDITKFEQEKTKEISSYKSKILVFEEKQMELLSQKSEFLEEISNYKLMISENEKEALSFKKEQINLSNQVSSLSKEKHELLLEKQTLEASLSQKLEELNILEGKKSQLEKKSQDLYFVKTELLNEVSQLRQQISDKEANFIILSQETIDLKQKLEPLELKYNEILEKNQELDSQIIAINQEKTSLQVFFENKLLDIEKAKIKEIEDLKLTIESNNSEFQKKLNTKTKTHTEMIKSKKAQIELLETSLKESEDQLFKSEGTLKEKKKELEALHERNEEYEHKETKQKEIINGLQNEIERIQEEKKKEVEICKDLNEKSSKLSIELDKTRKEFEEHEKNNEKRLETTKLEASRTLTELATKLESSDRKIKLLTDKIEELKLSLNESQESLETMKKQKEKEYLEAIEREKSHVSKEFSEVLEEIKGKNQDLQAKLSVLESERKDLKDKLQNYKELASEKERTLNEKIEVREKQIQDLSVTLEKMSLEMNNLNEKMKEFDDMTQEIDTLKAENDELKRKLEEVNQNTDDARRKELDSFNSQIKELNSSINILKNSLEKEKNNRKKIEKELEDKEKHISMNNSKNQVELQNMINNLTVSYERLLKENIRLTDENRENAEKIELLENDLQDITEEKDKLLVEMSKLLNQ